MSKKVAIHWFRQDLRLRDNPALTLAAQHGRVLPIYILDDNNAETYTMGAASRWWLHHSLQSLNASLGGTLSIYQGNPLDILKDIIARQGVVAVFWNRCYEPWRTQRDTHIKQQLTAQGIVTESANGSLLWEPWTIKKSDGSPYKVFTPFYRNGCLQSQAPREPLPKPKQMDCLADREGSYELDQLKLLPQAPWGQALQAHWEIGEEGAHQRFFQFVKDGLFNYKEGRNLPAKPYVSRLSPHLHFGEVSPNQLWHSVQGVEQNQNTDHFCNELAWREFSYNQLYHNPSLPNKNLQPRFNAFPWVDNKALLCAWQQGKTGVPMVDAGMRELWHTGYMHGRVRMIVGSFLVKNLRLHWQQGERWFWDTLVDADLASNSAGWQWIAGCGADAAPYFRIFNPASQGQKFDPDGDYVRRWIPEIAALPDKYLFNPWEAPQALLKQAQITLSSTYPKPIVDLKESRNAALAAFQSIKRMAPPLHTSD